MASDKDDARTNPPPRVLVCDDDRTQADLLANMLRLEDFEVATANSGPDALAKLDLEPFDAVVSDYRMPGMTGLELFHETRRRGHLGVFIVVTAFGTLETAVEAMRQGVHDFATKPVDLSVLTLRLRKALAAKAMETENQALRNTVEALGEKEKVIGVSKAFTEVLERAAQVALSQATVLLRGESGTGKEMLARAIHLRSPRRAGPFVALNCAAVPDNLLEDELFGHVRGAFTGAMSERKGRFALARGGTIFLDEIGDLPLHLQPKLLRVLQEREIEPVGSGRPEKVDVRVVAATHRDLRQMIAEGKFREDLYYRLNVIPLAIPPLRERRDDILVLARHFAARFARENLRKLSGFTPAAEERLVAYAWPGNVRELENCVERAVVLARGDRLDAEDLLASPTLPQNDGVVDRVLDTLFTTGVPLEDFETRVIVAALARCDGNLSKTARRLGMTRRSLQYRVEKIRGAAAEDPPADEGEDR